ncbi:MAG: 30S ribosomal protein S9 [Acidobacteria bacterium]|nr:30S ribosomal protein S9 [Acidobacteriota bacterium]MBI3655552.1 30S ribosomal protein S9 [Acidobacteriota bacterium]
MEVQYYGTGKRKSSTARVFLFPGKGSIRVNRHTLADYFKTEPDRQTVRTPLLLTESLEKFDVYINVEGGGHSGQAGAIRLGISRALLQYNNELRIRLKRAGFLTRDPRVKERKKYGQKGARKRFQFSKR